MQEFLHRDGATSETKTHDPLLQEMKMEALLATENSPYLEVRANVDPTDDMDMPSLTFRVLFVGTVFSCAGSFIDTLFGYRQPAISVGANVAQLLAYPLCKAMEKLPKHQFNTFGWRWTLNPGKFNKKEHMLITIMANVSFTAPYTNYIIPVQVSDHMKQHRLMSRLCRSSSTKSLPTTWDTSSSTRSAPTLSATVWPVSAAASSSTPPLPCGRRPSSRLA